MPARCDAQGLAAMRAGQIFGAVHFNQPRDGALKRKRQPLAGIQQVRRGSGGTDQVDMAVVKLVNQGNETARGIIVMAVKHRDPGQQHGMEFGGDLDVIAGRARAFAQSGKIAPEHAPGAGMHRNLALVDDDIEVNASPILAASTLRRNLWQRAYGVLLCSATLTALGRFERLRSRAGLPENTHCQVVPSPFDYAKAGLLRVPDLKVEPSDSAAHSAAISAVLPELLEASQGSLVLFSSRRQMQEVFEALPVEFAERILLQGAKSKQKILEAHRERIENGQPSVLFGLASFAEGIDLPGALCEHVVIAKIPFAVPDEPVEATLAEWIKASGGNPFMQISVPDASLKLIQACGRLIRSENDSGTITLLDRRLLTRPYGKAILASLPPFRRELR